MALHIVATKYLLDPKDLIHLHMVDKERYMSLYPKVREMYDAYLNSDKYRRDTIRDMNKMSNMINQFKWRNKILNNMMYDYIIICYENWSWITLNNFKTKLKWPSSIHFERFLQEHGIKHNDLLPSVEFHYTHHHRPTKQFTYYKTITY